MVVSCHGGFLRQKKAAASAQIAVAACSFIDADRGIGSHPYLFAAEDFACPFVVRWHRTGGALFQLKAVLFGPAERVTERGPQVRPSRRDEHPTGFFQALLRPGGFDIDQSQSAETDLPRFRGEVGVWDPGYLL